MVCIENEVFCGKCFEFSVQQRQLALPLFLLVVITISASRTKPDVIFIGFYFIYKHLLPQRVSVFISHL